MDGRSGERLNLRIVLTLCGVLLAAAASASAEPAPSPSPAPPSDPCGDTALLATIDRPTVGFSACAVKPRTILEEIGYANEQIESAGGHSTSITYPQGFLRFGAARNLELDVIGPAYAVQANAGVVQPGALNSGLGLKWEFAHNATSEAAIDVLQTFGTGNATVGGGTPTTTLNLDFGRSLTQTLGAAMTMGIQSGTGNALDGSSARFTALLPSAVVTDQVRENLQFYLEAYGQTRLRPDGGSKFALDGGVQYLFSPRFEIDFEVGRTVTDVSRSHYYGFGFGVKI
jgi:hypothetical protein